MTSRNITVFITGGTKKLELDEPFLTGHDTTIQLKRATVFWKFRNVTRANSNYYFDKQSLTQGGANERKTLDGGYWDFELLKKRMEEEKIELEASVHDNKCLLKNTNTETIDLKNFGKLLGFNVDTTIPTGQTPEAPHPVDVNLGLRYLTIACDLADTFRNVDINGGVDANIAYLPIPPGTRLNSTVSMYENHPVVLTKEDIVTEMTFTMGSNITNEVEVDVLLNLVVSGIREYN